MTLFYRQPSPTSDLGRHADLLPGLPADPEALGAIVRGLLVHNFDAEVRGLSFPAERMAHMETVGAEAILDNVFSIDPAPVNVERPVERRMVGFCYHFALLHCALLRATGTPARIRCGFAGDFVAQRWIDHWVVEYWDGDGWLLTDPQIGRSGLTSDDFQDGPSAWNQSRRCFAARCVRQRRTVGLGRIAGSLINDVAALNKVEVSGWYWCDRLQVEPLDQPHGELDSSLDVLSHRAATAESVETIKESFNLYPDLQPPPGAVAR